MAWQVVALLVFFVMRDTSDSYIPPSAGHNWLQEWFFMNMTFIGVMITCFVTNWDSAVLQALLPLCLKQTKHSVQTASRLLSRDSPAPPLASLTTPAGNACAASSTASATSVDEDVDIESNPVPSGSSQPQLNPLGMGLSALDDTTSGQQMQKVKIVKVKPQSTSPPFVATHEGTSQLNEAPFAAVVAPEELDYSLNPDLRPAKDDFDDGHVPSSSSEAEAVQEITASGAATTSINASALAPTAAPPRAPLPVSAERSLSRSHHTLSRETIVRRVFSAFKETDDFANDLEAAKRTWYQRLWGDRSLETRVDYISLVCFMLGYAVASWRMLARLNWNPSDAFEPQ